MAKDDKAEIEYISDLLGGEKLHYIGYSQGTVQMHYALATDTESWYKDRLHRAILFSPCFIASGPELDVFTQPVYEFVSQQLKNFGIYKFNLPTWTTNDIISLDFDLTNPIKMLDFVKTAVDNVQAVSVKSQEHWIKNHLKNGFYEWRDTWEEYTDKALIDVS